VSQLPGGLNGGGAWDIDRQLENLFKIGCLSGLFSGNHQNLANLHPPGIHLGVGRHQRLHRYPV